MVLFSSQGIAFDFDSYCHGFCINRYQDGIYRKGKCGCIDYFPINTNTKIYLPKPAPGYSILTTDGAGDPILEKTYTDDP